MTTIFEDSALNSQQGAALTKNKTQPAETVSNEVSTDPLGPEEIMGPMRQIKVRDGARTVAFNGQLLGFISSERPDSLRWTELSIYRNDAGRFIAHRVGVSCVAHRIDCDVIKGKKLPSIVDMKTDEFAVADRQPCPVCRPNIVAEVADDPASIRGETDRHWTGICDDAVSLLNALHTMKNGARSLSGLASAALNMAAENDDQIAAALAIPLEI
jgi:hypothetical protein